MAVTSPRQNVKVKIQPQNINIESLGFMGYYTGQPHLTFTVISAVNM